MIEYEFKVKGRSGNVITNLLKTDSSVTYAMDIKLSRGQIKEERVTGEGQKRVREKVIHRIAQEFR